MNKRTVETAFADGGEIANLMDGYRPRAGQLSLSLAVERSLEAGSILVAEAPAGVGKSFGYGVPIAIRAADRTEDEVRSKALVVTSNIALQEQLVARDLPFLSSAFGGTVSSAVLKGRGNYLCWTRLAKYFDEETALAGADLALVERIRKWAEEQEAGGTGDRSELPAGLYDDRLWSRLVCGEGDCRGNACKNAGRCFFGKAKDRAFAADVVVCNYHVLFSAMKVAEEKGVTIRDVFLPPFEIVVFDEAHKAADTARAFFGFEVSVGSFKRAVSVLKKTDSKALAETVESEGRVLMKALEYRALRPDYKSRLRQKGEFDGSGACIALTSAGMECRRFARETYDEEEKADLRLAANRCEKLATKIKEAENLADESAVYFIEIDRNGARLCSKAIDVSNRLRAGLWEKMKAAAVVSATLRVDGKFDYAIAELGIPKERVVFEAVPTPFDFSRQAMLVVPESIPEPTSPSFGPAVGKELRKIVEFVGGRTMALFTSRKVLEEARRSLVGCEFEVLVQGDAPRTRLLERFRTNVTSVLLGLSSFWEGVDVPGEALTCLVIDRLPFPRPDDPVLDAIEGRIGSRAFFEFSIPRAVTTFCQGFGRLIRSVDDRGIVVVLDRRLVEKPYGRTFLRSLPSGTKISRRIEDAGDLLVAPRPSAERFEKAVEALDWVDEIASL